MEPNITRDTQSLLLYHFAWKLILVSTKIQFNGITVFDQKRQFNEMTGCNEITACDQNRQFNLKFIILLEFPYIFVFHFMLDNL